MKITDSYSCLKGCDILWICFDTPVDENDVADTKYVIDKIISILPYVEDGTIVLISSQLPIGSVSHLENKFKNIRPDGHINFTYVPENLRLGKAINVFKNSERIVVGIRSTKDRDKIEYLLSKFCDKLLWVGVESAEMSKHALNSFLAMSVTFANELARLCEVSGAQMSEVERTLRAEPRIGTHAYIRPGSAFGGGTLARDVQFLMQLSRLTSNEIPLISNIINSNSLHKNWSILRLKTLLGKLSDKKIGVLGLAYKAGTNSTRRSHAIDLANLLLENGAIVSAYDPQVTELPFLLDGMTIHSNIIDIFKCSDAIIIATECSEFKDINFCKLIHLMNRAIIIDQNGFLEHSFTQCANLTYLKVGTSL